VLSYRNGNNLLYTGQTDHIDIRMKEKNERKKKDKKINRRKK
jgi:predicted GIY-YIG superfamily endonuclease